MSDTASGSGQFASTAALRQNAVSLLLLLLISAAFVLRFAVSPQIMNMFVLYTAKEGEFYEKLHFGTYAIFVMVPIAFLMRSMALRDADAGKFRALVYFTGWIFALIVLSVALRGPSAAGYFIDTYLVAGAAGLLMYSVSEPVRRGIGNVVLVLLLLSALIGIVEAATTTRLFPYYANELVFRPVGLADHPLTLGMMCAMAIGFVASTRWRIATKSGAVLLLLVGAAASGARLATLLAAAEVLAILVFVPWTSLTRQQERRAKGVVLIIVLVGGAAMIGLLLAGGLLSRFGATLLDENFMARIIVYEVFGYVGWKDIVFGANLDGILAIVNKELGLPYIESTPVFLIFQLGLPLAIAFALLVIWIFRQLLRNAQRSAIFAVVVFFLAALSNNTLSTKTPSVAMVIVLAIAFAASRSGQSRR